MIARVLRPSPAAEDGEVDDGVEPHRHARRVSGGTGHASTRPRTEFAKTPPAPNRSPADGYQYFGHVAIDGATGVMTVSLRDLDGNVLYTTKLDPAHHRRR